MPPHKKRWLAGKEDEAQHGWRVVSALLDLIHTLTSLVRRAELPCKT